MPEFVGVTFRIKEGAEFLRGSTMLRAKDLESEHITDVMRAVGRYVREISMVRQFDAEGAYFGGGKWLYVDAEWADWKSSAFLSDMIGLRTGVMRETFTTRDADATISRQGYEKRGSPGNWRFNRPTKLTGVPILWAEGKSVTVGGGASETNSRGKTRLYVEAFNMDRPIFGHRGSVSKADEKALGKLVGLLYTQIAAKGGFGIKGEKDTADAITTEYFGQEVGAI